MFRTTVLALLLSLAGSAVAASEDTIRFGGLVAANNYHVDDPDGDTDDKLAAAFEGFITYEVTRGARLVGSIGRHSFKLNGSTSVVGQSVKGNAYSLSYQGLWRLSREIKPWLGVGLAYVSYDHTNRFLCTTSTCTFANHLANRKTSDYAGLLSANVEWPVSSTIDLGLRLQYARSFNNQSSNVGLSVYVLY